MQSPLPLSIDQVQLSKSLVQRCSPLLKGLTTCVHGITLNLHGALIRMFVCRYALAPFAAFKANLRREYTLMVRHGFVYVFRTCQVFQNVLDPPSSPPPPPHAAVGIFQFCWHTYVRLGMGMSWQLATDAIDSEMYQKRRYLRYHQFHAKVYICCLLDWLAYVTLQSMMTCRIHWSLCHPAPGGLALPSSD